MISAVTLRFGSSAHTPKLKLDTEFCVNLFIGPNNSGKSLALQELNALASGPAHGVRPLIVESIDYPTLSPAEISEFINSFSSEPREGEMTQADSVILDINGRRIVLGTQLIHSILSDPIHNKDFYSQNFSGPFIINLNGSNRLSLVNATERGDLKYPNNLLARLLMNDAERKLLREKIHKSTGLYFAIDAFVGSALEVKFSSKEPLNERELSDDNAAYMRNARHIHQVSDGIKAYTGILMYMHFGTGRILIIDEPEAFLHPSLSFSLGKEIGRSSWTQKRTVFCSTHSSHFLMGCVASGARVNIIRLTYSGGIPSARTIDSEKLYAMLNDPILRSANVMSGLFYEGVIVTEADSDRAFYSEVNERLLRSSDNRGISHSLFINSNGKHSIHRLIGPLREAGIPAAGIVDIDLFVDGGAEFTNILRSINVPEAEHDAYRSRRANIHSYLKSSDQNFKKNGGITVLSGQSLEAALNFIKDLAQYGFFIVPVGEVEAWLSELSVPRSKHRWLYSIFTAMGNTPDLAGYVEPADGDVWDFVGGISRWIGNPLRSGMPA